jgi:glucokinase
VLLAGDIGGTKTHLALYRPGDSPREPALDRKFASREHASLEALVAAFLAAAAARPERVALGIAGPVVGNRVETTNLPWRIDGTALGATLGGARVLLMNDLAATARGVDLLRPGELAVLQAGVAAAGNRAIVAAGTGLGESLIVPEYGGWRPIASEGGHGDFGARDALEDGLAAWLRARYGRASGEHVLSGPGLADLYRFLSERGLGAEPAGFAATFAAAPDPAAHVAEAALAGTNERARLALERFASMYGAEAGNVALRFLAVGGVFLGGGIAPRILPFLRAPAFLAAFRDKGRMESLLARVPVSVILEDRAALWGAAAVALAPEPWVEASR